MLITCKCLNVTINTKGSVLSHIDITDLNLSDAEQGDPFFKERLATVELGRISKEQPFLVQIHNVGKWIIHFCLNCLTNTHAIHHDKGAAFVLVNEALLTDSSLISALKSSENYSHVFRILVKCSDEELSSPQIPSKFSASHLNGAAQAAMSALQQHLGEVIQQEVAHTEERVRQYTEQQYTALEEFRERAHREHRVLARLLFDAQENLPISPANLISLSTPPPTPDSCGILDTPRSLVQSSKGGGNSVMASAIRQQSATRKQPSSLIDTRQANRPSPLTSSPATGNTKVERRLPLRLFGQTPARRSDSFDTEGLFDLEGMEGTPTENFHSEDESDTDDSGSHDEGIHIPRGRSDSNSFLAKSLPVKVPTYLPSNKRGGEDGDDERLPQDPMDIAASIKALAKSVHGDAVFGDLPRPRFSTQI